MLHISFDIVKAFMVNRSKRYLVSHDISEEDATKLVEDRAKFKLYAAEQHLKNLINLEQNGITMHSFKGRVHWEMEIESFLFHLVGVSDSLLAKTNDKLKLKLKDRDVKIEKIKILLNYLNEESLLLNLRKLDKQNWFHELRRWRNQVTHINFA
ncbi:MAG: hypothetical protein M3P08_11070 [Thermoproteota archaeon]|nr:hypothetical protein [Thermoproteota archaeon]